MVTVMVRFCWDVNSDLKRSSNGELVPGAERAIELSHEGSMCLTISGLKRA